MKKIVSMLLCLVMLLGLVVVPANAASGVTFSFKTNHQGALLRSQEITVEVYVNGIVSVDQMGLLVDNLNSDVFEITSVSSSVKQLSEEELKQSVENDVSLSYNKATMVDAGVERKGVAITWAKPVTLPGSMKLCTIKLRVKNTAPYADVKITGEASANVGSTRHTVAVQGLNVTIAKCTSHKWDAGKVTNPTIKGTTVTHGYTTFTCTKCGEKRVENYTFPDVRNKEWYYQSVEFSVAKGFFSGHGNGTFGPSNGITRQDFVVVLARIAGADLSKYSGVTDFKDVSSKAYYAKAIHWASSNKVVMGYNDTEFGVDDKITREQLVTILYRYAMKKGYNISVTGNAMTKLNAFSDANKISTYSKSACAWALEKGVLSGKNATTFDPTGAATRAQVATILMNISLKKIMPI